MGIRSLSYELPGETTQDELLALVDRLNGDADVNGILVQLPLPTPHRRADGNRDAFRRTRTWTRSTRRTWAGSCSVWTASLPCTPAGIMRLLAESRHRRPRARTASSIGRSNIVGKPMALLLLQGERHGERLPLQVRPIWLFTHGRRTSSSWPSGRAKFITADMVSEGTVIVDVGMNREDGKLCGDVDFEPCAQKASYITPVPGGVGPMTIAMLMENTFRAWEHAQR